MDNRINFVLYPDDKDNSLFHAGYMVKIKDMAIICDSEAKAEEILADPNEVELRIFEIIGKEEQEE